MATRIYLPSSGAASVTPSTWNFPNQINPLTFAGVITRLNSTQTTRLQATGTTSPILKAMFRWIIGPLATQSIAGTINLVMQCFESSALANATLAVAIKIIQPSGVDRAVLLAAVGSDSAASPQEMGTTPLANKRAWNLTEVRPIPLTSQNAISGDYLVIEVGFRSATTTTRNISIRYGDTTSGELADADSGANDYAPWIDFSQTLLFPEQKSGSAVISENGSQVGSVLKGGKGSGLVSVIGTLVAIGVAGMLAIASISGGGTQVATGTKSVSANVVVSGNGSIVATGEVGTETHSGTAIISGNGITLSEGIKGIQDSVTISTKGDLVVFGTKSILSTAILSVGGLTTSTGIKETSDSGVISGAGLVIGTGIKVGLGTGGISEGGTITGIGTKQTSGVSIITDGGSLIATGTKGEGETHSGIAVISGDGILTSIGNKGGRGTALTTGNGIVTCTGVAEGEFKRPYYQYEYIKIGSQTGFWYKKRKE